MTPFLAWEAICKASCHWWALEQLFADALPKVSKENTKQKNIKKHAMRTKSKHQVLTTFSSQCLKHTNIPKYLQLLNLCFEPWDNHHVGKMPSPNVGCPLSVLQVLNMDYVVWVGGPLSVMKVPWAASDPASHHTLDGLCEVLHTARPWWVLSLLHPTKYDWC